MWRVLPRGSRDTGTVAIGFVDAATFEVLPTAAQELPRTYPGVSIVCHQLSRRSWREPSSLARLDLAIQDGMTVGSESELRTVLLEPICVAVSRNSPLSWLRDLSISELANQAFVLPVQEDVASVRPGFLRICHEAGFAPLIVAHATRRFK